MMSGEFIRLYIAPFLTPAIVIIGWFFVSRDNDRRETRKELRSLINDFNKKIDNLTETSIGYLSEIDNIASPAEALKSEIAIKQAIDRLELTFLIIKKTDPSYTKIEPFFDSFTNELTGHEKFESRSFNGTVAIGSDSLLRIALTAKQLNEEAETIFIDTQILPKCSFFD